MDAFPNAVTGAKGLYEASKGNSEVGFTRVFYYFSTDVTSDHKIKKYTYKGPSGL